MQKQNGFQIEDKNTLNNISNIKYHGVHVCWGKKKGEHTTEAALIDLGSYPAHW